MKLSKEIIILADIVNYSIKGITGALGKGEGLTKEMRPIFFRIKDGSDVNDLINILSGTKFLENGDIIVLPSKLIAVLEKRFVYGLTIDNYNECINNLKFARNNLQLFDKKPLTKKDIIGLDKIDPEKGVGVRYSDNPNQSAFNIAKEVKKILA